MNILFGFLVLFAFGCTETSTKSDSSKKTVNSDIQSSKQVVASPMTTSYQSDSITDSRDRETYGVVRIGNQTWMAENLKYNSPVSRLNPNNPSTKYGRVYTWMAAQKACPNGWHLPSDSEWNELEINLGMLNNDTGATTWRGNHGVKMKSRSDWAEDGNGTNSSNFNVFPGGHYFEGKFNDIGYTSGYWSATGNIDNNLAWVRFIAGPIKGVNRIESDTEKSELFCRCVKD